MKNRLKSAAPIDFSTLDNYLKTNVIPGAPERDRESQFCNEILRELHNLRILRAPLPVDCGGGGLSTSQALWIARKLGYASAGVFISYLGNLLGSSPVALYGSNDLKRIIHENSSDYALWSFCMTELGAGTDVASIQTSAEVTPNGFVINGSKHLITNATYSQHLVVFARLKGIKTGITAFYVPAHTPGVRRGRVLKKIGLRESNTAEIHFEDVHIPAHHLIGEPGLGLKILQHCIQRSKTLISGAAVGVCDRAFEIVQTELSKRVRYGESLLNKPLIQNQLAQRHTEAAAAWLLGCVAAETWDTGDFAVKEASMAKLFASDTAFKCVHECMELLGGHAFTEDLEIERLYRDVKSFEIVEGASLVQQSIIAKELFREKIRKPNEMQKITKKAS